MSVELVTAKLDAAQSLGVLSSDDRTQLQQRQVFSPDSPSHNSLSGRLDRVCVAVGIDTLKGRGLDLLLDTWGGEGVFKGAKDLEKLLTSIGTPSIVVLDLQLTGREFRSWGPVMALFSALLAGDEVWDAEIHVLDSVAPSEVVEIWQPGMREFDQLNQ
ncbi:hypothetical protein [Aeromicrobium sp. 9AM]|uniref:hypothetical protein n=1 Tax=Aeromicrobium sp. 9AM TaxID=2653126 RepID=UPI001F1C3C14|nr:hypothetical protein [Aeromicrobium sp. 9AM]